MWLWTPATSSFASAFLLTAFMLLWTSYTSVFLLKVITLYIGLSESGRTIPDVIKSPGLAYQPLCFCRGLCFDIVGGLNVSNGVKFHLTFYVYFASSLEVCLFPFSELSKLDDPLIHGSSEVIHNIICVLLFKQVIPVSTLVELGIDAFMECRLLLNGLLSSGLVFVMLCIIFFFLFLRALLEVVQNCFVLYRLSCLACIGHWHCSIYSLNLMLQNNVCDDGFLCFPILLLFLLAIFIQTFLSIYLFTFVTENFITHSSIQTPSYSCGGFCALK